MKRIIILTVTALALTLLTIPVLAAEVCPEAGKVESQVDGDLNDIILEAGTEVCIKGSTDLVIVTADGASTLYQLLGNGHDVSHYTVLESTTTTTLPVETTTTIADTTTTTVLETTSTAPSTTSTVVTGSMEELPTVIIEPLVVTTSTTVPAVVLPFTGPDDVGPWMLLGFALAALGTVLVWTFMGDER